MVYNVIIYLLVLIIIVACLLSDVIKLVINFEYLIMLMVSDNYYICYLINKCLSLQRVKYIHCCISIYQIISSTRHVG